jgi:hypothetical protein
MAKIRKAGLWSVAGGLLILVGFIWFVGANAPKRNRYLIPEGYAGWLCVTYAVSGASPLEAEDGYRLVKFSVSGVVETSTQGKPGKYKDEFWFYAGNTRRQMNTEKEMGGGYTVAQSENPDRYTFMFWVSPNAKAQQLPYSPDRPNRCGPANENRT